MKNISKTKFSTTSTLESKINNSNILELTEDDMSQVSGGDRNTGHMIAGSGMMSGSIGLAALGAVALGPIGIIAAVGLALGGGYMFGSGGWGHYNNHATGSGY